VGHRRKEGFTLVEILVALVVLAVGVLALVGSSAVSVRMVGRGFDDTSVSQVASARLEWLRQLAGSTSPGCTHPGFAGDSAVTGGIAEAWTVAPAGVARQVALALRYRAARGVVHDTVFAIMLCR
jgi:prepilin-type N-terminal cleavage/methylation domain-containing protein